MVKHQNQRGAKLVVEILLLTIATSYLSRLHYFAHYLVQLQASKFSFSVADSLYCWNRQINCVLGGEKRLYRQQIHLWISTSYITAKVCVWTFQYKTQRAKWKKCFLCQVSRNGLRLSTKVFLWSKQMLNSMFYSGCSIESIYKVPLMRSGACGNNTFAKDLNVLAIDCTERWTT